MQEPGAVFHSDHATFSDQLRKRLKEAFGVFQISTGDHPAFEALSRPATHLLWGIAAHFQLHDEANPSQETLAKRLKWGVSIVRLALRELERFGFIVTRRERIYDGSEKLHYSPGPVFLAALAAFVEHGPGIAKTYPKKEPRRATVRPLYPATVSTAPPAVESGGESISKFNKPFSSEPPAAHGEPEEEELALGVLRARFARLCPEAPPPPWFDRAQVDLVVRCARSCPGSLDERRQALADALDGAWLTSKTGAPHVSFIFGTWEHFCRHQSTGRARRLAAARAAQPRAVRPAPVSAEPACTDGERVAFAEAATAAMLQLIRGVN